MVVVDSGKSFFLSYLKVVLVNVQCVACFLVSGQVATTQSIIKAHAEPQKSMFLKNNLHGHSF